MPFFVFFSTLCFAVKVGEKAPDFNLKATDGREYGLKKALAQHEEAVIVFMATKCPYSNAYNERFNSLADQLQKQGAKGVAFLAVNSNDTEPFDDVKAHAQEKKFSFSVLKDEKHKVADAFGAERTPEAFLVGKDGTILYHGRIDDDTDGKNIQRKDVVVAVGESLSGKPVSVKETKFFGCSIKRK